MIDNSKIDQTFEQLSGTLVCILASYAIAAKYYCPKLDIDNAFEDYCHHFGESFDEGMAKRTYDAHFDNEFRTRGVSGFEIIKELHDTSSQPFFQTARSAFSAEHRLVERAQPAKFEPLKHDLKSVPESIACISVDQNGQGAHGVCVYFSTLGEFYERPPEVLVPRRWQGVHNFDECLFLARTN